MVREVIATFDPKNEASTALLEEWGIEQKEWIKDEEDEKGGYWKVILKS